MFWLLKAIHRTEPKERASSTNKQGQLLIRQLSGSTENKEASIALSKVACLVGRTYTTFDPSFLVLLAEFLIFELN